MELEQPTIQNKSKKNIYINLKIDIRHQAIRKQKTCVKEQLNYSGFRHVMIANLMRSFLYPSIINGIANAPFIVFHPAEYEY